MRLQPVDLSFAARAPYACIHDTDIAAPPAAVFDALADLESWPVRFGPATRGEWITTPPHGIGTVRAVQVGAFYLVECFVAWEPGRRFAFTIIEANLPFARAMLEDVRIVESRAGSRVTSAVYYAPPLLLRPVAAAIARRIDRTSRATLMNLKQSIEGRA